MKSPPIPDMRSRIRRQRGLWFGLLGGPLAWAGHLGVAYYLVPDACAAGSSALLHVVTFVAVAVAVAAIASAWRVRRAAHPSDDGIASERGAFAGVVGLALSSLFLLVILMEGLPPLLIDPCL